jgi:hypothetical protein
MSTDDSQFVHCEVAVKVAVNTVRHHVSETLTRKTMQTAAKCATACIEHPERSCTCRCTHVTVIKATSLDLKCSPDCLGKHS